MMLAQANNVPPLAQSNVQAWQGNNGSNRLPQQGSYLHPTQQQLPMGLSQPAPLHPEVARLELLQPSWPSIEGKQKGGFVKWGFGECTVRVKIITGSLVILENLFLQNTVTITVLKSA